METNPLVTVFISVYNSQEYIRETINSILNQTYSNLEIIIVDDGSTDKSGEIIKGYRDQRIKLFENGENKGIPYTRNRGLEEANGKYLAIMDADDIAYSDRIEKQLVFMEKNKDIDVLGSYYRTHGNRVPRDMKTRFVKPKEIKINLLFNNNIANPTSFIRLESLNNSNIKYNLDYFVAQDYEMWAQISKTGKLYVLPEVLLKYRVGHLNISKKSKKNNVDTRKKLIDSIQIDLLNYYGFELSSTEVKTYNDFFTDNPQVYPTLSSQSVFFLIANLIKENADKQIFDQYLFEEVIYEATFNALKKMNVSLKEKYGVLFKINRLINKRLMNRATGILSDSIIKMIK